MARRCFLCCLVALALLAGLPVAHADQAATPPPYRIAVADELSILVVDSPDLSLSVPVRPDGKIAYPYVGELNVAGMTVEELRQRLVEVLRKQLKRPEVTVTVKPAAAVRQVSVLGAVKSPGKFTYREGARLLDLLAECGGLSIERPEWARANLLREGEAIGVDLVALVTQLDALQNRALLPGDILWVQEMDQSRTHVQVLGEVMKPGPVPIPRDGSLVAALMAAGGPTARASLARAAIVRGAKTLEVDLSGVIVSGRVTSALTLEPGDSLFVPPNRQRILVTGAVAKPGVQDYPDGERLTVVSALSLAGNQTPEADLKHAALVRPGPDGKPQTTPLDLEQVLHKGDLSKNVFVEPGDVLYVPSKRRGSRFTINDVVQGAWLLQIFRR